MNAKKINANIALLSGVVNVLGLAVIVVFVAKAIWWLVSPTAPNVYIERFAINQFDGSAKHIINSYPFGVVQAVAAAKAPSVLDKIQLVGVYATMGQAGAAFINIDDKHAVFMLGDDIGDGVKLIGIKANSIVVEYQGTRSTINLTGSSNAATQGVTSDTPNNNSSSASFPSSGLMSSPPLNAQPTSNNNYGDTNTTYDDAASSDIRQRRKQLIEEFERQAAANRARSESNSR